MAKKDIDEIKKLIKTDKLVMGTKSTIKNLREGKLAKVVLSSNCPEDVEEEITNFADLTKVNVTKINIPNDELGVLCKKQFLISVLGIYKWK